MQENKIQKKTSHILKASCNSLGINVQPSSFKCLNTCRELNQNKINENNLVGDSAKNLRTHQYICKKYDISTNTLQLINQ